MKTRETFFTVPNILSGYRILAIPVLIWALFSGERTLFITLICSNLITDILDGWIARRWKLETEFGARLDSAADIGTFLLSIAGFWVFEKTFVSQHTAAFAVMFGMYLLAQLTSLFKFGRPTSLHLYTSKMLGYIQGIFIFTFFVFGYWPMYFCFMVAASVLAELEVLVAVLLLPKPISNGRSVFHILKCKSNGTL